jgi:hypothetical protein
MATRIPRLRTQAAALLTGAWLALGLLTHGAPAAAAELKFERTALSDRKFEACSAADVDRDGKLDIISGEYWYAGPDFKKAHQYTSIAAAGEYFDDFSDYPIGTIETIRYWDVDGDGQVEVCPNSAKLVYFKLITDAQGKGTGAFKQIIPLDTDQGHGLGFGDINGDGRGDFVVAGGWVEAPEKPNEQPWTKHAEFDLGLASVPIIVDDVNGDGRADLIVGCAHDYGLYWLEQQPGPDGKRNWIRHDIDKEHSQYHDMMMVDLDNDGQLELVTGKRYRAHNEHDPGSFDPVGVYYFKLEHGQFIRHTIDYGPADRHSGVGIYFWVQDLDGDGWKDIIAPGKQGLAVFKNLGLHD